MPSVTIPEKLEPIVNYIVQGSEHQFTFKFFVVRTEDLFVYVNDKLVDKNNYTVTGIDNPQGGYVDINKNLQPLVKGDQVTLFRFTLPEQLTEFIRLGDFTAIAVNAEFNRLYALMQELRRDALTKYDDDDQEIEGHVHFEDITFEYTGKPDSPVQLKEYKAEIKSLWSDSREQWKRINQNAKNIESAGMISPKDKGLYINAPTLNNNFEFCTYGGQVYFAVSSPYSTKPDLFANPDDDQMLYRGDYATKDDINDGISAQRLEDGCADAWGIKYDGSDITDAFNHALLNSRAGVHFENGKTVRIDGDVIIPDNAIITGDVTFEIYGSMCFGSRHKDGTLIPYTKPSIYYKNQHYLAAGYAFNKTTRNMYKGTKRIFCETPSDFEVGDYIYITNGYTDMWRVTSNQTFLPKDYVRPDVDLWLAEWHEVTEVLSDSVRIATPLGFDCPLIPKTYGLYPDENNRSDAEGFNVPNVEKAIGCKNIIIDGATFKSMSDGMAINGISNRNVKVRNIGIYPAAGNTHEQFILHASINGTFENIKGSSDLTNFALRRVSTGNTVDVVSVQYGGGSDSAFSFWELSYNNTGDNIHVTGYSNVSDSRGIYLNTQRNNTLTNITGKGLNKVVALGYYGQGTKVTGITSKDCDSAWYAYYGQSYTVSNMTQEGIYQNSGSESPDGDVWAKSYGFTNYGCLDFKIKGYKQVGIGNLKMCYGAARHMLSTGYDLTDIYAPQSALYDIIESRRDIHKDMLRADLQHCVFNSLQLSSETYNLDNTRDGSYIDCKFNNYSLITYAHYQDFRSCKFYGQSGRALTFNLAPYNTFIDTLFDSDNVAPIDFGASGNPNKMAVYIDPTCRIQSPSGYFVNNVDIEPTILANSISPFARGGEMVSVLTQYPQMRVYKNSQIFGNQTQWSLTIETKGWV